MASQLGRWTRRTLTVLLLVLAMPATASAASAWLPAENVSSEFPGCLPPCLFGLTSAQVAMDADGNTVVVWTEPDGPNRKIMWSARPAGGDFSAPDLIATVPAVILAFDLAVDDAGNATVAYPRLEMTPPPATYTVDVATRPPGGDFSAPQPLFTPGPSFVFSAAAAANGDGNAVVVWTRGTGVEAAVRTANGSFGAPIPVPGATSTLGMPPLAAIDTDGNVLVNWTDSAFAIKASYRPAGGSFQATPDPVSSSGTAAFAGDVAFDDSGNAVMLFAQGAIKRAFRPKAGPVGAPADVSASGAAGPQLGVAGDGSAIATWLRGSVAEVSSRPAGGEFGSPASLGATGIPGLPGVAVNRSGEGLVAWIATDPAPPFTRRIEYVTRAPGGALSAVDKATDFASSGMPPAIDVALDADGNGALGFVETSTTFTDRVKVAGFDAAGPRLRSLDVPATGVAGEALGFGVDAVDVWSPLASTTWSFGDGATAEGGSVQHSYANAGSYDVTLTATDALGNASSATRSLSIDAPPPVNTPVEPDATAPLVSDVSMLRRVFAVGRTPTPVRAARKRKRRKRGTEFRFTVSEASSVRIRIQRARPGRKARGKCRRPTRKLRHRKRCRRWVGRGRLIRSVQPGPNAVPFSGRIGRRALKPGRYRASLKATDAAGNASPVKRVRFRVVRG